jgi:hypothetical protein
MQPFGCMSEFASKIRMFPLESVPYSGVMTAEFRPALRVALEEALNHLENLDHAPVAAQADLAGLRLRLAKPLADDGMAAETVVTDLVRDTAGGHLG